MLKEKMPPLIHRHRWWGSKPRLCHLAAWDAAHVTVPLCASYLTSGEDKVQRVSY